MGAGPWRMPGFVGIGFQKCGTTTLFDLLAAHPDIALARDVKEPMFYRVPIFYILQWPWRRRYYAWRYFGHIAADDPRLVGEVNAGLGFNGCAGMLTRDFDHNTKLFFMMRNPVDRAWSAFKFFCALGFLPGKVIADDIAQGHAAAFHRYCESVLGDPKQRQQIGRHRLKYLCFSQGNYADLIGEYAAFPHKHFILFEEFVKDQRGECEQLYDFLGISHPEEGIPYGMKANETNRRAVTPFKAKWRLVVKGFDYTFDEFFALSHWWPWAYQKHKAHTRRCFYKCTAPDEEKSKMLPETRKLLEDYYRPQKDRVAALLGRSLDEIWFA